MTARENSVPMFGTLIASRPERERNRGIILTAVLALHALLVLLAVMFTAVPRRITLRDTGEEVTFFRIEEDQATQQATTQQLVFHPNISTLTLAEPTAVPSFAPRIAPSRFPGQPVPGAVTPLQGGAAGPARTGRALRPGERLQPYMIDPRLWAPTPEVLGSPAREAERARARIYSRLNEINDSIAAEAEAKRKGLDWTIKGKDGEKWGISPDGIHLGKLTLPAPQMSQGGTQGMEARRAVSDWNEIQKAADMARVRSSFDDRVRAIRERKDKERKETQKQQQPPAEKKDEAAPDNQKDAPPPAPKQEEKPVT